MGLKFGIYEDAGYFECGDDVRRQRRAEWWRQGPLSPGRAIVCIVGSRFPEAGWLQHVRTERQQQSRCLPQGQCSGECGIEIHVDRPIVFLNRSSGRFRGARPNFTTCLVGSAVTVNFGARARTWRITRRNFLSLRASRACSGITPSLQPLGRFQKPGGWNDADFVIGGDDGMSVEETRSQMALWSMMSAPLILSVDVGALTPESVAILGNKAVIAVDQDAAGKDATLIRRNPEMDILFKKLSGGDYAVAVLNRAAVNATPGELESGGFRLSGNRGMHAGRAGSLDGSETTGCNRFAGQGSQS